MLQETPVTSELEALELERWWQHLWAVNLPDRRFTFWRIGDCKRGGVGILIRPQVQLCVSPLKEEHWSERLLAITVDKRALVNVYAVNSRHEREVFSRDS